MKSVLLFGGRLAPGGLQSQLVRLCRILAQEDAQVTVVAHGCPPDSRAVASIRELGHRVILGPSWTARSAGLTKLWLFLLSVPLAFRKFDTVYAVGPSTAFILLFRLKRLLGRDDFFVYHEPASPYSRTTTAGRCIANSHGTVANSKGICRVVEGLFPGSPVKVIPYLTCDAPFPLPARKRAALGDGLLRIAFLGRIAPQKRPHELVKRWKSITAGPPLAPARLRLHGNDPTGEIQEQIDRTIREDGLEEEVECRGIYTPEDLDDILAETDLLVLPSTWEGLPLVLVEAMGRGIPVASTVAGGTAEIGEDNPDVSITSTDFDDFVAGLKDLAARLRAGQIDPRRLHSWTEARYGYDCVSRRWKNAILEPEAFFDTPDSPASAASRAEPRHAPSR